MNTKMNKILVLIGIVISSIFSYSQEDISYDYPYKAYDTEKSDKKISITTTDGKNIKVEYYGSAEGSKDTLFYRKYTSYTEDGQPHPSAKEIKQKWHENPNWWCYELFGNSDEYYEGKIDSLGSVIDYYYENYYNLYNLDIKAVPLVLIHMNASQTGVIIGVKNLPTALIPSTIVLANPNI